MTQHTLARIDTENLYVPQDVNPPPAYTPFPDDGSPLDLKRDKPLPPLPQEHSEEIKPAVPPKDKEDVLAILRRYDTVIIFDDSVSMRDKNKWTQAQDIFYQLGSIASSYDTDGIDLRFLNNDHADGYDLRNVASAEENFRAAGYLGPVSYLGSKLDALLREYWLSLQSAQAEACRNHGHLLHYIKPVSYIVITDGHIDDDLRQVIWRWADELEAENFPLHQVGIQIVQIGSDEAATKELDELDQYLRTRDMLDITQYNGQEDHWIAESVRNKILTGGINPRMQQVLEAQDHREAQMPSPSK